MDNGNMTPDDEENVVSMTECTGLIAALPEDKGEEEAYKDIYNLPESDKNKS